MGWGGGVREVSFGAFIIIIIFFFFGFDTLAKSQSAKIIAELTPMFPGRWCEAATV